MTNYCHIHPTQEADSCQECINKLAPIKIKHEWYSGCRCCGGKLVTIRGKHPKDPERTICPTCVVERLEDMVFQISMSAQTAKATTSELKETK